MYADVQNFPLAKKSIAKNALSQNVLQYQSQH